MESEALGRLTSDLALPAPFKLCRREVPECGVPTVRVVEALEVIEDRRPHGAPVGKRSSRERLSL